MYMYVFLVNHRNSQNWNSHSIRLELIGMAWLWSGGILECPKCSYYRFGRRRVRSRLCTLHQLCKLLELGAPWRTATLFSPALSRCIMRECSCTWRWGLRSLRGFHRYQGWRTWEQTGEVQSNRSGSNRIHWRRKVELSGYKTICPLEVSQHSTDWDSISGTELRRLGTSRDTPSGRRTWYHVLQLWDTSRRPPARVGCTTCSLHLWLSYRWSSRTWGISYGFLYVLQGTWVKIAASGRTVNRQRTHPSASWTRWSKDMAFGIVQSSNRGRRRFRILLGSCPPWRRCH